MSRFTQKYALVQFFDDVKEGATYSSDEWPLHSTVVDTFATDWPVEQIIAKLTAMLNGHAAAISTAGVDAYFGEKGQVQVVLIDKTDSITALHLDVLATLDQGGLILNDPQFAYDGFLPHATVQKHKRLKSGDEVQFRALSIVDMFPDEDPYRRKVLKTIDLNSLNIQLLVPDVVRDPVFALDWFDGTEGHSTLLSMGNAESEIHPSTLESETETIQDFLKLEEDGKQITRMIRIDDKTIGAVWIELFENHGVKAPSVHIMVGNPEYRGKGIGSSVMQSAIDYAKSDLKYQTIYSRHLVSNSAIEKLNAGLGFINEGESYVDDNGLEWQGIKLDLG